MIIRRKIKRSTKQYIVVAIICIVVMGGAAAFTAIMISEQVKERYTTLLRDAKQEIDENKKVVYVATSDIMTGEAITSNNVECKSILSTQPIESFISEKDIGKLALIDITLGTQVLKGMLTSDEISSELREIEYTVVNINSNIISNDTVDVRISYPNGESYVVLSKKIIKGFTPETATCFFWLNEEEYLRMSAAIVDAGLYSGSRLVTTKYIEPRIQDASIVTYTPSLQILSLIENDPNIVERCSQELNKSVRKSLENRLASSIGVDVTATDWDVSDDQFQSEFEETIESESEIESINIPTVTPDEIPAATPTPIITYVPDQELGASDSGKQQPQKDYMFYAEEEKEKGDIMEYGE